MKNLARRFGIAGSIAAAMLLLLAGRAVQPLAPEAVSSTLLAQHVGPPVPIYGEADHTLDCVGRLLRARNTQQILIGYAVADGTGKTGVDYGLLMRSVLSRIAAQAGTVGVTSMGYGPGARPDLPSVEERELLRDPARAARLVRPDWLITGGTTSVTNDFLSLQKTGGLSAAEVDYDGRTSSSVDLISASFGLKHYDTGVDFGRTVDVRVGYQRLSRSDEISLFASSRQPGPSSIAGLRFGRTAAVSQVAEDSVRASIAWAVVQLFADRFALDLGACAAPSSGGEPALATGLALPFARELPGIYRSMAPTQRIRWFQQALPALGYAVGGVDGKLGARTREALARCGADHGLPPSGVASEALFLVLATRQIAFGLDPRDLGPVNDAAEHRNVSVKQISASFQPGASRHADASVSGGAAVLVP